MDLNIIVIAGAILVAALALLLSPVVRAICWDSFAHPRYRCIWEKRGNRMHELRAGVDYPVER